MKIHDQMGPLRDVHFPFLQLESTQSHSPGQQTPYTERRPSSLAGVSTVSHTGVSKLWVKFIMAILNSNLQCSGTLANIGFGDFRNSSSSLCSVRLCKYCAISFPALSVPLLVSASEHNVCFLSKPEDFCLCTGTVDSWLDTGLDQLAYIHSTIICCSL